MKLYRSIGEKELAHLLNGCVVQGLYNCKTEKQNNSNEENVCCFFVDEMRWRDKEHCFVIVVDIPEEYLTFGVGEYWASKEMKKTKIWTGRTGSELYKIREAYIPSYSLSDVKEIYLFGRYVNWVIEKMKPICEKNDVVLHWQDSSTLFAENVTLFKYYSTCYQTIENLQEWLENKNVDKEKVIAKVKKEILNTPLTYEQACKIQQILRVS